MKRPVCIYARWCRRRHVHSKPNWLLIVTFSNHYSFMVLYGSEK